MSIELYDHQETSVSSVLTKWQEFDRLLGVAATGAGKTIIFGNIAEQRIEAGPVLILAHRDELLEQAQDKIWRALQKLAEREQADRRASLASDIVLGSVRTLSRACRLERFSRNHFRTVIVDEGHRTPAESYLRILEYFKEAKVLGVTATPDRGDRRSLSRYYQEIAFDISLTELIKGKWLCPIRIKTVPLAIDISRVAMRAGDYSEEELAQALEPVLRELAQAIKQHAAGRKSLIFLPLVRTAYEFAKILREHGLAAEAICGESPKRKEILRRFRDGETQLLCNAMLLTEGYDEPSIDCVIVLRPTTIRSLYSQQVGRGTRIHPGKENLLLLDFLWLTRQHDLIRPAALIAKDQDQQAEIEAQLERADGDLLGAQSLAQVEREAQLQRGLDERRGEGGYEIDLLELATRFAAPDIVDYRPTFAWERKAITEKQALTLRRNRVELALVRDRGHASVILARLFAWLEREPTSRKQKIYCHFLGHPQPWELTKAQANRWIAQHKAKLTQTTS